MKCNHTRYGILDMWCLVCHRLPLPSGVVHAESFAESANMFKTRLDKFLMSQEIIYDYHAEIHGTGSQSEIYCFEAVLLLEY